MVTNLSRTGWTMPDAGAWWGGLTDLTCPFGTWAYVLDDDGGSSNPAGAPQAMPRSQVASSGPGRWAVTPGEVPGISWLRTTRAPM